MADNRFAVIRYHALDKCFSNFKRRFYMKDLENAVRYALDDYSTKKIKITRRQIYSDILFMKSLEGYNAPIERFRDGQQVYYRYSTPSFSLINKGLTEAELDMIRDTVMMMKLLKGFPRMEWTEELVIRLNELTQAGDNTPPIIGYQENPYLKGLELFDPLYQSIKNHKVLELEYRSFRKPEPVSYTFHPHLLKEYNARWFVLGKSEGYNDPSLFALDRIISIKEANLSYIPATLDFEEHFDDVIGVSVAKDAPLVTVRLQVHKDAWPYIETKPLHHSQTRIKDLDQDDYVGLQFKLKINYELKANLLYRGSKIKVLEPQSLVEWMREETRKMYAYYQ